MEEDLQKIYSVIDYVLFVIIFVLELYVIAYKLRFRMDKAGYIILITQLIVMFIKLFHSQSRNPIQPVLVLTGYTISEATYSFLFLK